MPLIASIKTASEPKKIENQPPIDVEHDLIEPRGDTDEKPKRTRSKRKPKNEKPKNQPTLSDIVNPKPEVSQPDVVVEAEGTVQEASPQDERRKRRRTSQFESADVGIEQVDTIEVSAGASDATPAVSYSPRVLIPRSSPLPRIQPLEHGIAGDDASEAVVKTPPKRVLKLNANGRFSSPPLKSPKEVPNTSPPMPPIDEDVTQKNDPILVETAPPKKILRLNANGRFSSPPSKNSGVDGEPKSRGRLRPRKTAVQPTSRIVSIAYGNNEPSRSSFGEKIDKILAGELTVSIQKKPSPKKRTPQKPRKPTHPFFSGKPEQPLSAPKPESPRKTSAITPGKLRVKAFSERLPDTTKEVEFSSALLKDRHMIKHPGAIEAPFPDRDQAHVRGGGYKIKQPMSGPTFDLIYGRRKHKQAVLPLSKRESVLDLFQSRLTAAKDPQLRSDGFHEPSDCLRIPERLLISGQEIAQNITGELSVPIADVDRDELSFSSAPSIKSSPYSCRPSQETPRVHSALSRLYDRIPSTLTPFDECKGEPLGWTQKYAPSTSVDVLQPDNEVAVLKDWLNSVSVQAVSNAIPDSKINQPKLAEKPKKKRKKKGDDMDDFLVDSDEDLREMNEIPTAPGVDPASSNTKGSLVQSVSDNVKLSNTVLLSGPHGCGKTAAAYAVAKELGFKVFEISSSERRSGRDVLEKVGDMTENHMVRHHGVDSADMQALEPSRNDEAFQRDLESGRQGKMNAFFKPQPTKRAPVEPKKIVKEKKIKAIQEAIKKPTKDQQQSLILLEEVDVLFKDDKDFWVTVIKLITTSKRPFIMTCNDENVLPLQAIALHAILRFKEPPLELATDYMLLMAAAEGHLLKREAVSCLYRNHQNDLRASIMELDYWCQMGVGDPRGGLTWIYQRYPPGSDLDEQGRKLRVVSSNTYQTNMGLPSEYELDVHGALSWAWDEFDVSPEIALGWDAMSTDVQIDESSDSTSIQSRRKRLSLFSKHADALSAADTCTAIGIAAMAPFDPSQPELLDKARNNYTIGQELLQTNEDIDYEELSKDIFISMMLSARQTYDSTLDDKTIISNALSNASQTKNRDQKLTRHSFACFDPIATSLELSLNNNPGLLQSAFDGTLETIVLDLAPYVRSIVQYDRTLEEQRARLNLLTSDGRSSKRQRTTRAARSALEGGERRSTRRERWFDKELDLEGVLATGGDGWPRLLMGDGDGGTEGTEGAAPASSAGSV